MNTVQLFDKNENELETFIETPSVGAFIIR